MYPAADMVRDREATHDLDEVARWLTERDDLCADAIEAWMVRGTSVSTDSLAHFWADRAWATALTDLVVETVDGHDVPIGREGSMVTGLLRGVSAGRGVAVLRRDGVTEWVARRRWTVPHPVELSDLQTWRVVAQELEVGQSVDQLERAVFWRDATAHPDDATIATFDAADDRREGQSLPIWENGGWVTAEIDRESARTQLRFRDADGRDLAFAAVGSIAWSEAVRAVTV
jgi:hypothetical protein